MRHRRSAALGLATALCLSACAEPAAVPRFPVAGADERTRAAAYDDYELHADIGAFSATWKRRDGEYNWGQLENVAQQFPESADVYGRANTRGLVLGSIAGVGGGLVGYTLGWNLTASEDKRWSSGAQVAMYSVGGGLIVIALVAGLAWHNPAEDSPASTTGRSAAV